jgi:toxin ParE1/3/4
MARDDLVGIARRIAQNQPEQARAFAAEQRERCNMLARHPAMGDQHEQLGNDMRVFPHGHYVILFCVLTSGVRIERVLSRAQDLPSILQQDF